MADDKMKQDGRDCSRVAADEDYEVQYLAAKTGIAAQARELVKRYGNDRATREAHARGLK